MIQKTRWINLRFFFVTFAGIISGILSFCAFLNLVVLKQFLFFQFLFVLFFLADVVLLFYIVFLFSFSCAKLRIIFRNIH